MGYLSDLRIEIGSRPVITPGATVLVVNDLREVLFQYRSDTLDWGFPGGSMELGESMEQVASRELKEETGLEAASFELIDIFSGTEYYFRYPNGDETFCVIALYHAKNVSGKIEMEDGESLKLEFFSESTLPQTIEKRAKTINESLGDELWRLESSFKS
ncbi:NUDIX hydrolase [Bacillus niameyensis]|uniref:NUDIX hydrolase n=1 Tax=Bacillus niameyensis TaxID=1522308 RepID=UPI0007847D19|nr:NUDIX hydrolase [Bacillus niameyensis]